MARNTRQVPGDEGAQAPGIVVIGWTSGGSGGAGQAYRVARAYGIPVADSARGGRFDTHTPALVRRIVEWTRVHAPADVAA